jgi:zinc and cadmium transporter
MVLIWILASISAVSLISLVGIFTFLLKGKSLQNVIFYFVGFSAGALIGGAFLHILPESLEKNSNTFVFSWVICGMALFFLMERYFYWRHCHDENCRVHSFTYLNLIGDGLHNFFDGMVIAASYTVSIQVGLATTFAVIFHEIPHELGNFAVLVYGGFKRSKALLFNFLTVLTAFAGALGGYFLAERTGHFSEFILPMTAGGFIYVASTDLIPEIHKENNQKRATLAFVAFLLGVIFMALAKKFFAE